MRLRQVVTTLALPLAVACGGGGGSAPLPGATAFATPGTTPTPSAAAYTFASVPAGIAVTIDGAPAGVTPLVTSPPFSATVHTVQFGGGANPYTTVVDQTNTSGSRTVFYNAVADTGTAFMSGNQSVLRRPLATALPPAAVTNGVYVRYDAAKLAGRTIAAIERDAGAGDGFDVLSPVAAIRGRVVRPGAGSDAAALTAQLRGDPAVAGVYPLHARLALGATAQGPNDPHFSDQWDLRRIFADYAWSYAHGQRAKIAIVDTGADLTHPDLAPLIAFAASSVGGKIDVSGGAAQDTNGHGTDVAGIATARTNDGTGFAGTAYGAQLYVYRAFPPATAASDLQQSDTGDEALAITDAVGRGVDVINLSLGAAQYALPAGSGFDQAEHDAIAAAIAAGVTVVAAAGNDGAATLDFPAAYDGVISTGASALHDGGTGSLANAFEYVASYSNSGPGLSVVAPGGDPPSPSDPDLLHWIFNDSTSTAAFAPDQCKAWTPPDVCKSLFAGTSQAAPHVSGAVALIQSALRLAGKSALTPAQMKALIEGTADNINDARQGHGRLNVLRAIESALGLPPTLPPPASAPAQFVAFAYTNAGPVNAAPRIVDVSAPRGLAVSTTGTFRIADVDPAQTPGAYRIGVWLDANGDGVVDAGDQFGAASVTCTATAACKPGTIAVAPVTAAAFALP